MQNFDEPISDLNEDFLLESGLEENLKQLIQNHEGLQPDALNAQIIQLSHTILLQAITRDASAIHIEPLEEGLRIRFRIDDVLHQSFELLPKSFISPIVNQFKTMANLFLDNRSIFPQSGMMQQIYHGGQIRFLVDTLPNRYGDKIVLRRQDINRVELGLDRLVIDRPSLQIIKEIVCHPFGLILVACPARNGMTTTLYSIIKQINSTELDICTADKFFEYNLPGITQVECSWEEDRDFTQIVRGFMKQDPDVILVDEIGDKQIAKTVIQATERCLVVAGLHLPDAPSTITRLDEMGIEPYLVSQALRGVISQRLLRRVCSNCAIPYTPTTAELTRFGLSTPIHEISIYKANTRKERLARKSLGNLCSSCHGIGYKGSIAAYQVMPITNRIQALIHGRASTDTLYQVAEAEGMKSFLDYCLDLVWQKYTTLEEVSRLIHYDCTILRRQRMTSPHERLQDLERQLNDIAFQIKQLKQQINQKLPNHPE